MRSPTILRMAPALLLTAGLAGASASDLPTAPDQVRPLLIGSQAPGGVWPNASGEGFDLGEALDAGPTVLVFYRAHW